MSTITTSALVCHGLNQPLVLEDVMLDEIRPDEAIVEIEASGVCHTDLSCMSGTIPAEFPNVFGHEGAGTVTKTGSAITHVQPGDKVLLSFNHCGSCAHCTASHPAYCASWAPLNFSGKRLDGTHMLRDAAGQTMHGTFFGQSSFMRLALVSGSSIVKVDPGTDLALFAALGCGFQTGAGCVLNTLRASAGSSLVVFGVGAVGMAGVMGGVIAGAKTIVAVDLSAERLQLARELGATHVVDAGSDEVVEARIRAICEPANGAQFAMDATGVPRVIETMVKCLGTKGRAATVGAPKPGSTVAIDVFQHLILGREYVGSTEGDVDARTFIPFLIEQHAKGRFPIDKLISYYDIKNFQTAFQDMKATKVIKPVLLWK